jgi:hypothetical protein
VAHLLKSPLLPRMFALFVGLLLTAHGLLMLLSGRWFARNYWGGQLFWPFTLTIGLFFIGFATFWWPAFRRRLEQKKESSTSNHKHPRRGKFANWHR